MAHPAYLRDKTRSLRVEKRLTIDELAQRLALPRTTIFYWVRDLPPLPSKQTVSQELGNRKMQVNYRRLREEACAEGRASFARLCEECTFRDFVVLYIAEGYKRNRNEVSISNSDPAVMAVAVTWLRRLTARRLKFSIQYHADQDLAELRVFWGRELAIDGESIRFQRKSNSGQLRGRTWRSQYGVLCITVYDTLLRARLQGWIDSAREEWTRLGT